MNYKPELGMIGNIKLLFKERNSTNNKVFNEANAREQADNENRDALEEALAGADETAIALYEAQEAQETINAQQDEALMELYEMKY